jgi:hypothetical protein
MSFLSPEWGPASTHPCPVEACSRRVRYEMLMCRNHWYQVPRPLRDAVWATWRSGAGAGTPAHTAAIGAAIDAVDRRNAP